MVATNDGLQQAPDWVNLGDLPLWLAKRHKLEGHEAEIAELAVTAVREGNLHHRIANLNAVRFFRSSGLNSPLVSRPQGFTKRGGHVAADVWDKFNPDWTAGTIGVVSPSHSDGAAEREDRFFIQVGWIEAVKWSCKPWVIPALRRRIVGSLAKAAISKETVETDSNLAQSPAAGADSRNQSLRVGPPPKKRQAIEARMRQDLQTDKAFLTDTLDNLASHYGASRGTVKKARENIMAERSRNTGETLNTDK